jgi:SNF2 family DNA or RNA helicase
LEQIRIVARLHKDFKGHMLRRTTNTKNSDGQVLLDIPPLNRIEVYLKLAPHEADIMAYLAENAKEKYVHGHNVFFSGFR